MNTDRVATWRERNATKLVVALAMFCTVVALGRLAGVVPQGFLNTEFLTGAATGSWAVLIVHLLANRARKA